MALLLDINAKVSQQVLRTSANITCEVNQKQHCFALQLTVIQTKSICIFTCCRSMKKYYQIKIAAILSNH